MKQLVHIHFIQGEPGLAMCVCVCVCVCVYLEEWEGLLLMLKFHWLRLKVLGRPHLHGEAPVTSRR